MFTALLMVLRYAFLLLLFVFIFRLFKLMVIDIGAGQCPEKPAGGRIVVVKSSLTEPGPGFSYDIGREITIGRGSGSGILIRDSFTSTRHARIFLKSGQYWLEDLKSTNGTYLNDSLAGRPVLLADGDKLQVGGVTFQFVRWGYEVVSGD